MQDTSRNLIWLMQQISKYWDYAFKNNYTIVTFDSDFIDLAKFKGIAP